MVLPIHDDAALRELRRKRVFHASLAWLRIGANLKIPRTRKRKMIEIELKRNSPARGTVCRHAFLHVRGGGCLCTRAGLFHFI